MYYKWGMLNAKVVTSYFSMGWSKLGTSMCSVRH